MLGFIPQPNLRLSLIWGLTMPLAYLRSHSAFDFGMSKVSGEASEVKR
ncbi:hypothetical protein [Nostoc sp. GT001]|nr:hypothetical protein [Nostoc sp. GT001]MDM9585945.1 hypothetical protein [Nostoc sp. GT001]